MQINVFLLTLIFAVSGLTSCSHKSGQVENGQTQNWPSVFEQCGVDPTEFERLMTLPYKAFDADVFGGWRVIDYREGCSLVASTVIENYINRKREPSLSASELRMLNWHAGQTTAYENETEALRLFRLTFENENADPLTDWDLYVVGTIAFLERDQLALEAAYEQLSTRSVSIEVQTRRRAYLEANPNITLPPGFVTEPMNLPALRGLLACFGEPYRIAYHQCTHDVE